MFFLCVCLMNECVVTRTHTPLPCAEILALPLSGEKGWLLDLEEGVSCQEWDRGGAVSEMTNLSSLSFSAQGPWNCQAPLGSAGLFISVYPLLFVGSDREWEPSKWSNYGCIQEEGLEPHQSPSLHSPLLPPIKLLLPQGRVVGTGGISPPPSQRSFTGSKRKERDGASGSRFLIAPMASILTR